MLRSVKLNFLATLVICCGTLYANEDFKAKVFQSKEGGALNYCIYQPDKIDTKKTYPLVLILHDAGRRGNDNKKQIQNIHARNISGPPEILSYAKQNKTDVVIIAPQVPQGQKWVNVSWGGLSHIMPPKPSASMQMTIALLKQCIKTMPIDTNRIYVMGQSMGGFGTWDIIQRCPELFAAAIPICGGGDTKQAPKLKHISIWAFHGYRDRCIKVSRSRDMIAAIKKAGGKPLYTEDKNVGHNWFRVYKNPDVLRWMFKQKKANKRID